MIWHYLWAALLYVVSPAYLLAMGIMCINRIRKEWQRMNRFLKVVYAFDAIMFPLIALYMFAGAIYLAVT